MKISFNITEDDWYIETGRRVKAARIDMNMTQEKLAVLADLKRSSITHIERGTQKTSVYTLYKISIILDKSFLELTPATKKGTEIEFKGEKTSVTPSAKNILDKLLED